jgi:glycerol-3-phosphate acyltransferase PlsY
MSWQEQLQAGNWGQVSSITLGAYLLGCLTTGYYLVRARTGQDIRELGSGNVGARNVGRVLGWMGFLVTVLGDCAKGALAVGGVQYFTNDERLVTLALIAVVVGHLWPAQLRFRGGKGVATSLGALVVYDPHLALALMVAFAIAFVLLRRTVLSALFAFVCLPMVCPWLGPEPFRVRAIGVSILAGLILVAHRRNLLEEMAQFLERRALHAKHHQSEL